MFQNFVEYNIDYTEPFTENQGWTPIDNWSYLGATNLEPIANYGGGPGRTAFCACPHSATAARMP